MGGQLAHDANDAIFVTVPFSRVFPGLSMLWRIYRGSFWQSFGRIEGAGDGAVVVQLEPSAKIFRVDLPEQA